jgi:hypothetical protein
MKAKQLRPGDRFTVTPPDPERPVRVCLTNDPEQGLRWGWPGNSRYWCYMGEECDVERAYIAEVDFDEATYVGDEEDGVYIGVGEGSDGWYVSTVVDSDTGSFVDALMMDDGPYPTEAQALEAGKGQAIEWCADNAVEWEAP